MTLVCNILTLHHYEVQSLGLVDVLMHGQPFLLSDNFSVYSSAPTSVPCPVKSKSAFALLTLSPTPSLSHLRKVTKALFSNTCMCLYRALLAPGPEVPGHKPSKMNR